MTAMFSGIFTPLITPITQHEGPDLTSLSRLVRFQIEGGVSGLWAMGTTSEFASFSESERAAVVETVVQEAEGRVPVIANVSDVSTRLTIRHARQAQRSGVQAIAATPPYYYPHSQDEVLAHYRAIRDAIELPLFIYNIPQTVRVRVELDTARELVTDRTAAGIKDSQNDLEWFRQLAIYVQQTNIPFALFAGTRYLIDAAVVVGASGAIPSFANAFPDVCVSVYDLAIRGEYAAASRLETGIVEIEGLAGVARGGSRNAGIIGLLKVILHRRGIIDSPGLTLPLRSLASEEAQHVWEGVESRLPSLSPSP